MNQSYSHGTEQIGLNVLDRLLTEVNPSSSLIPDGFLDCAVGNADSSVFNARWSCQ